MAKQQIKSSTSFQEFNKLLDIVNQPNYREITTKKSRSEVIERMAELALLRLREIAYNKKHENKGNN